MKIWHSVCSGDKATPSSLYDTYMGAFSYILRSSTNDSISFDNASILLSQSETQTFSEQTEVSLTTSASTGNACLFIGTCLFDSIINDLNVIDKTDIVGSPVFRNLSGTDLKPISQKFTVNDNISLSPNETITTELYHNDTGIGHDHLSVILNYKCDSSFVDVEPNTVEILKDITATGVEVPINPIQSQDDLIIVGVIHRFPLETPEGWTLDFSESVAGTNSNVIPYYKNQRISVYSKTVPSFLPISNPVFKVLGADEENIRFTGNDFQFTIETTSVDEVFDFNCNNVGVFDADIDWGDGFSVDNITTYNDPSLQHTYSVPGTYTITVAGTLPNIDFSQSTSKDSITQVNKLGNVGWLALDSAFDGCNNLTLINAASSDVSQVTDFSNFASNCPSLTVLDASSWDTSNVTSFNSFIANNSNIATLDISGWNISNVTDFTDFALNVTLPTSVYDNILMEWSGQSVQSNIIIDFGNSKNTLSSTVTNYKLDLIETYNWTINDAVKSFILNIDTTGDNNFSINCTNIGTYTAIIDWGDGSNDRISAYNDANLNHSYTSAGLYTIEIIGLLPNVNFFNESRLKQVTSLGDMGWLDLQGAFQNCASLTSINAANTDVSQVTDFSFFAYFCTSLTTFDVSGWDTSNVTDFNNFMVGAKIATLDVANWNVSNVTNFQSFAQSCTSLTILDVSAWDTSSVTNFANFIQNCNILTTLDVSGWNVGNVTSFFNFVGNCNSLTTLDVSAWDTSSVLFFNFFIAASGITTIDVSNWNTSNVTDFSYFAFLCNSLTTLDVSAWDTSSAVRIRNFADSCGSLTVLDVSNWNTSNVTDFRQFVFDCTSLTTLDVTNWNTSSATNFRSFVSGCTNLVGFNPSNFLISSVTDFSFFASDVTISTIDYNNTLLNWSSQGVQLDVTVDFGNSIHTIGGAESLAKQDLINLYNWTIIDLVEDFVFTVETTSSNETITIPCQNIGTFNANIDWGDGSSVDHITTYNDADLAHTFSSPGTHTISISGLFPNIYFFNAPDRAKVREVIELGQVGWTNLNFAFRGCTGLTSVTSTVDGVSSVTAFSNFVRDCTSLTTLNVGVWDTSSATTFSFFAFNCASLTTFDVSGWDTSSVTDFGSFIRQCSALTTLDVSSWDTSNVTDFSFFATNASLTSLDVSGWDTSSATTFIFSFTGCDFVTLDVSNWNTINVTDFSYFINNCGNLTSLNSENWNTINVINFDSFALGCSSLTTLGVTNWNTNSVTNFARFVQNDLLLTTLDVSGWNVGNVTNFQSFASDCDSLTTLDVSSWNPSNATNFSFFVSDCSALTTLDVSSWDTSSVTNFSGFILRCSSIAGFNPSNWNIGNVTNFGFFALLATIPTVNYDATLINWDAQTVQPNLNVDFGNSQYTSGSAAQTARSNLITSDGWTISDGGAV